jgi:hypothetical protein
LEIVADPFNPPAKLALIDPTAEIVDFILRAGSGPNPNQVALTKRMAKLEVAGT